MSSFYRWLISSASGTNGPPFILSCRYFQNDIPNFLQVFFRLINVSRQRLPSSLRVLPLTFRFFTWPRMSRSLPLVCNGTSGRFSTSNSSSLCSHNRFSSRFNITYTVFCLNIRSNRLDSRLDLLDEGALW